MSHPTQAASSPKLPRILRLDEVMAVTGRRRSVIMEDIAAGTFPAPLELSERGRGWLESEIAAWVQQRIAARDAGRPRQPEAFRRIHEERQRRKEAAKAARKMKQASRKTRAQR
jgi:prophage regulatory protein